jgi:hypothetical protein
MALVFSKIYYILGQLHCPFSDSARGVSVAEDVIQWLIGEDSDSMGFEVVAKLSGTHDYHVTYLFHL